MIELFSLFFLQVFIFQTADGANPVSCRALLRDNYNELSGVKTLEISGNVFQTYCWFERTKYGAAFELIESWGLQNNQDEKFARVPFYNDDPRGVPSDFQDFRLPKARIQNMIGTAGNDADSLFIATCNQNFNTDFFITNVDDMKPFADRPNNNVYYEHIMVRSDYYSNVWVGSYQDWQCHWHISGDSNYPFTWQIGSEDDFGFYGNLNSNHACVASPTSTTNYWIARRLHADQPYFYPHYKHEDKGFHCVYYDATQCWCPLNFVKVGDFCSQCATDYFGAGNKCDETYCNGVPTTDPPENICSGHGTCYKYNDCQCTSGEYGGTWCDEWYCDGTLSGQPGVCGGNGVCVDHNDCECVSGAYEQTVMNCVLCPANSGTKGAVGSTSIDQCVCDAGYEGSSGSCTICGIGFYSSALQNDPESRTCIACPHSKTTIAEGATSVDDCVCDLGTYGAAGAADTCLSCMEDSYADEKNLGSCKACGDNSGTQTAQGSTSVDKCVCNEGYEGASGSCTICDFGEYSGSLSGIPETRSCSACPFSKTTISQATTTVDSCVCDLGTVGTAGSENTCSDCIADYYSDEKDLATCKSCGSYSGTQTATKSTSLNDCVCDAGYEGSAGSCSICGFGSYSSSLSGVPLARTCETCLFSKTTIAEGTTSDTGCVCDLGTAGTSGSGDTCTPCSANYYSDVKDLAACKQCGANSGTKGASGSQDVDKCVCNVGYAGSSGACTICDFGEYSGALSGIPEVRSCSTCLFSKTTVSQASSSVDDCVCDLGTAGTSGAADTCDPCSEDSYADEKNLASCKVCGDNSGTQTVQGSTSVDKCVCNEGYGGSSGSCSICDFGEYSGSLSGIPETRSCSSCPFSKTTISQATTTVDSCVCDLGTAGTAGSGEACSDCIADFYSDEKNLATCKSCGSHSGTQTATKSTSLDDCVCDTGYEGSAGSCSICGFGSYSSSLSGVPLARTCETCLFSKTTIAEGTTSDTGCVCDLGTAGTAGSGDTCAPCSPNYYSDVKDLATCKQCGSNSGTKGASGSQDVDKCVCNVGYSGSSGACTICDFGEYSGALSGSPEVRSCSACLFSKTTVSQASSSVDDCVCDLGTAGTAGAADTCNPCSEDSYADEKNLASCKVCGDNSGTQTVQGSTSVDKCVCDIGYSGSSGVCTICDYGEYSGDLSGSPEARSCSTCLFSKTTESQASSSVDDCVCDLGTAGTAGAADTCDACSEDSYADEKNLASCKVCGDNSGTQTGLGSTSVDACVCDEGYEGASGSCTICDFGEYSGSLSGIPETRSCSACPFSKTTISQATTTVDSCVCDLGTAGTAGSGEACSDCIADFYSDEKDLATCKSCGSYSGTQTATKSTSLNDCVCDAGYEGSAGSCSICGFGSYSSSLSGVPLARTCESCLFSKTTIAEGTTSDAGCVCDLGTAGASGSGDTCTPCSPNYYSDVKDLPTCKQCGANSGTKGASGSQDVDKCVCNVGYSGFSGACTICDFGEYSGDLSGSPEVRSCSTCLFSKTTVSQASSSVDDCVCDLGTAGTAGAADTCGTCSEDSYADEKNLASCKACGDNSGTQTAQGSTSVDACVCDEGYEGASGSCTVCDFGEYSGSLSGIPETRSCSACPFLKTTISQATTTVDSCVCDLGTAGTAGSGDTCSDCIADFYSDEKDLATCKSCGSYSGTQTATKSTSLNDCVCDAGYEGSAGSCSICGFGSYSSSLSGVPLARTCETCLFSKTTIAEGTTSDTGCVCDLGTAGTSGSGDTCNTCLTDYYSDVKDLLNCKACGAYSGTKGVSGSQSIDKCVCDVGHSGVSGVCAICTINEYSTDLSGSPESRSCQTCTDAHATSVAGSHGISSCICDEGYGGDSNVCSECSAGWYSDELVGDVRTCKECTHAHASSSAGSHLISKCVCEEGYEGGSNSCTECSANWYSGDLVGDIRTCYECTDSHATSNALSHGISKCICDPGYGGQDNSCSICPSGWYSGDLVADVRACVQCGEHSGTQGAEASTSVDDCVCDEGYSGSSGVCVVCTSGKYSTELVLGERTCLDCPPGSTSSEGSHGPDSCGCDEGYGGSPGSCSQCLANEYSSAVVDGARTCELCSDHTTSAAGSHGAASCVCDPGYEGQDNICSICSSGWYSGNLIGGVRDCIQCPSHSSTKGSDGSTSIDDCVCDEGYSGSSGACVECSAGWYSGDLVGDVRTCFECTDAHSSSNVASHGLSSCTCDPGYEGQDNSCSVCSSGWYSGDLVLGARECFECPPQTSTKAIAGSTSIDDCVCDEGYSGVSGVCEICDVGSYSGSLFGSPETRNCDLCPFSKTTFSQGTTTVDDCVCDYGTFGTSGSEDTCSDCIVNEYADEKNLASCKTCGENSGTQGTTKSTSINACVCDLGYAGSAGNCIICVMGSFSSDLSGDPMERTCEVCPFLKTTLVSGTSSSAGCVCDLGKAGGHGSEDTCISCGVGSYSDEKGLLTCNLCGEGWFNPSEGSTTSEDCEVCPHGTWSELPATDECTPCGEGFFNPNTASTSASVCTVCPHGSWSSEVAAQDCVDCGPGMILFGVGSVSNGCSPCPAGTFSSFDRSGNCSSCSNGWISGEGDALCEVCSEGKYDVNYNHVECRECEKGHMCSGGVKTACPIGEVASTNGLNACTKCAVGTYEQDRTDCLDCPDGNIRPEGASECSLCGEGTYANDEKSECVPCEDGYFCKDGVKLNLFSCDGIWADDTSRVCSGNGRCVGNDDCDCVHSVGKWCEQYYPHPSSFLSCPEMSGACSTTIVLASALGYEYELIWESNITTHEFTQLSTQYFQYDVPQPGLYYISMYIVDYWGRVSETDTVYLNKLAFDYPLATISGDGEIFVFANSKDVSLEGYSQSSCLTETDADLYDYRWEQVQPITVPVDTTGMDLESRNIVFSNGFPLQETQHHFELTVSSQMGSSSESVVISVILRDLVALTNDSSRSVPVGVEIFVDGSSSYDQEESSFDEIFSWNLWENGVESATVQVSTDGKIASFTPMTEGEYELEMTYAKDSRVSTFLMKYDAFVIVDDYIPVISIERLPFPIGGGDKVTIVAHIETDLHPEKSHDVVFMWECDSINLREATLSDDLGSLSLTLRPGSIYEDTLFTLNAYYKTVSVFATTIVEVNDGAPKNGRVEIFPPENNVFEDFQISINNWIDNSPPLKYKLYYYHVITGEKKIVRDWSTKSEFMFAISSQGCRQANYSVDLIIEVADYYGATTTVVKDVKVYPVEYSSVVEFIEYVIVHLSSEPTYSLTEHISVLFQEMFQVYNLRSPECDSVEFQEQMCMTKEECESFDIVNANPELLAEFLVESLQFFIEFMDNFDQDSRSSMVELIKLQGEILSEIDVTNDVFDNVLNASAVFLDNFFNGIDTPLELEDLRTFWELVDLLYVKGSVVMKKRLYQYVHTLSSVFLKRLALRENNEYLESTDNILFNYIKDYSSVYKLNAKLRMFGKSIEVNGIHVDIPPEVSLGFDLFDVINTFSFSFNESDDDSHELGVFFSNDDGILPAKELNDPVRIRFPILSESGDNNKNRRAVITPNAMNGWGKSLRCIQEDLFEEMESVECKSKFDKTEGHIECECDSTNKMYRLVIVEENRKEKQASVSPTVVAASVIIPILVCVIVSVAIATVAIVVLYFNLRRKKHMKVSNSTKVESFFECELEENGSGGEEDEYVGGDKELDEFDSFVEDFSENATTSFSDDDEEEEEDQKPLLKEGKDKETTSSVDALSKDDKEEKSASMEVISLAENEKSLQFDVEDALFGSHQDHEGKASSSKNKGRGKKKKKSDGYVNKKKKFEHSCMEDTEMEAGVFHEDVGEFKEMGPDGDDDFLDEFGHLIKFEQSEQGPFGAPKTGALRMTAEFPRDLVRKRMRHIQRAIYSALLKSIGDDDDGDVNYDVKMKSPNKANKNVMKSEKGRKGFNRIMDEENSTSGVLPIPSNMDIDSWDKFEKPRKSRQTKKVAMEMEEMEMENCSLPTPEKIGKGGKGRDSRLTTTKSAEKVFEDVELKETDAKKKKKDVKILEAPKALMSDDSTPKKARREEKVLKVNEANKNMSTSDTTPIPTPLQCQSLPLSEMRRIQRMRMNSPTVEEKQAGKSSNKSTISNTTEGVGIKKLSRSQSRHSKKGFSRVGENEGFASPKRSESSRKVTNVRSPGLARRSAHRSVSSLRGVERMEVSAKPNLEVDSKMDTKNEEYEKLSQQLLEEKRKKREEEYQAMMRNRSMPNVDGVEGVLNTSNVEFQKMLEERRKAGGGRSFQIDHEGIDVSDAEKVVDARNMWYLKMKKEKERERQNKNFVQKFKKKSYEKVESKLAGYLNKSNGNFKSL